MRSLLVLRSPSDGTGWQERWSFSGRDDTRLRQCLAQLDQFRTEPPVERFDANHGHIIEGDRWAAAMLLHPDEASPESYGILPPAAEAGLDLAGGGPTGGAAAGAVR